MCEEHYQIQKRGFKKQVLEWKKHFGFKRWLVERPFEINSIQNRIPEVQQLLESELRGEMQSDVRFDET